MPFSPNYHEAESELEKAYQSLYRKSEYVDSLPPKLQTKYFSLLGDLSSVRVKTQKLHEALQKEGLS